MQPVYEVVSGQILLHRRARFFELHNGVLLPIMREVGITPALMLLTEIGRYCRFLDVYRYPDLVQYDQLTERLLAHPRIPAYYEEIGHCIDGGLTIELMSELPYAHSWTEA